MSPLIGLPAILVAWACGGFVRDVVNPMAARLIGAGMVAVAAGVVALVVVQSGGLESSWEPPLVMRVVVLILFWSGVFSIGRSFRRGKRESDQGRRAVPVGDETSGSATEAQADK